MRFLISLLLCSTVLLGIGRAEPLLKHDDVIAFVGGEDMVAMAEYSYLEAILTRAMPELHLRFRSLAWEGDTVFEQRRDLNYPTLEQQLASTGATVVFAQFGEMESLEGKQGLAPFLAAYEKMLKRLSGKGRRVVVLTPSSIELTTNPPHGDPASTADYSEPILDLAATKGMTAIDILKNPVDDFGVPDADVASELWRDGIHFTEHGHAIAAVVIAAQLNVDSWGLLHLAPDADAPYQTIPTHIASLDRLRKLIQKKNLLWFQYYRPQNWAFLAGDRTNQPSSRDYRDPSKRWFPGEMEQWLPLIEQKETEIAKLAAELGTESK